MMPEKLITIVIPVYNRREIVGRTLDSVAAQSYRPMSVILVDNNSTDGTYDELCRWRDSVSTDCFDVTVITERKPGAPAARNAALPLIKTPWVMFFDSDDTMAPSHVADVAAAIEAHPETEIMGWNVNLHFLDGKEVEKPFVIRDALFNCIINGTFATQRYACRTNMIRETGGWNESVPVWNDIELATRLLTRFPHANMLKVSGCVPVTVYQSEESITGPDFHSNGWKREIALRYMYDAVKDDEKVIVDLKSLILAALYRKEGHKKDSKRLYDTVMARARGLSRRLLYRFVYEYTSRGGRGAARLVKPFI